MSKLDTFKKLWAEDKHQAFVAIYNHIVYSGITNLLSDRVYLKLTYRIRFGKKLDFNNPITFNQKIQWLKLYDRQERYIELVDKVRVKDYVAREIGAQYLIPTLGVYDSFEEIDFKRLPSQFVLKCNHDSGSIIICKDKSTFDLEYAKKKLTKALNTDAYYWGREWPYKSVRRKIIAEAYMEDEDPGELKDYRQIIYNEKEKDSFARRDCLSKDGLRIAFFDTDWKVMPFERYYPKNELEIKKPLNDVEMIELAEELAKDIPFVRIDFYEVRNKTYFGEITLLPDFDRDGFTPSERDKILGSWIKLPWGGVILIKENVVIHFPFKKSRDLTDYKIFCFNGEPQYCQIITSRSKDEKIDFYDMEWKLQPFVGLTPLVGNSGFLFPKPNHFDEMKEIAKKLSSDTPFSRIDFYEVQGKLYFGEFTLYPASGFGEFSPTEWNKKLGDMISLDQI